MSSRQWTSCLAIVLIALAGCDGGVAQTVRHQPPPLPTPTSVVTATPDPAPRPVLPTSVAVKNADDVFLTGKIDEAQRLYRNRVLLNGADLDAHDGLIRASMKLGKLDETVTWYQKRLNERSFASAPWAYATARALLMSGDLEQSSELAYTALRHDRALGRAYYLLGLKYRTQASPEYKTASNAFNKAIKLEKHVDTNKLEIAEILSI